jgi:hypothetical protein
MPKDDTAVFRAVIEFAFLAEEAHESNFGHLLNAFMDAVTDPKGKADAQRRALRLAIDSKP